MQNSRSNLICDFSSGSPVGEVQFPNATEGINHLNNYSYKINRKLS